MRARPIIVLSLFGLLSTGLFLCVGDAIHGLETGSQVDIDRTGREAPARHTDDERTRIESPDRVGGPYGAPVGSRFTFDFQHRTIYSLDMLEGHGDGFVPTKGEPMTIPVLGRLNAQVVARDGQTVTVLLQAADVTTPVGGTPNAQGMASLGACRETLEHWFLVRIDPQGSILGYAFQRGPRASDRNFVRSLVATFFHHTDAANSWQAKGVDASGEFLADYRTIATEPLTVERHKVRYTRIGREAEVPAHTVSGSSRATFAGGFLHTVQADEAMSLDVVEFPSRVHVRTKARFARIESSWRGVEVDPAEWPAFVAASGALEDLAADGRANDEQRWRDLLAEVSVEELIEALRAQLHDTRSREFYAAWERLHWKLALDTEAVAKVRESVLNGVFDERLGSMVLSALGKAGSEAAQAALLAVYGAEHLGAGWRESATIAMFQIRKPTAAVMERVAAGLADLRAVRQQDATSMLLFGTLAPRSSEALANGRSPLQQLLSLEGRSNDLQATGLWLDALGNAGVPAIGPHAARYLDHGDAIVRESAVAAMDQSGAPGVAAKLIPLAEKDPSTDVRIRAIEALGKRSDAAGRASIRRLATTAEEVGVRRAAVQALIARQPMAAADRDTLRRVAQQDRDPDIRAAAQQLLGGRR